MGKVPRPVRAGGPGHLPRASVDRLGGVTDEIGDDLGTGALMSVLPLIVVFPIGAWQFLRDLAAGATKM
ncbi:hypothetical protein ACFV2H_17365 [Streptomyces sp. NPDC059629]|uniref:hypothetical protein n=1 Tax=Streptomyces sp. NPDC059629 TaxID=3346889 RepID=UPI0036AC1A7C